MYHLAICIEHGIGFETSPRVDHLAAYRSAYKQGSMKSLRRLQSQVACELLKTAKVLFYSKSRTGRHSIASLPREVLESILFFMDEAGVLTRGQQINISNIARDRECFNQVAMLHSIVGNNKELHKRVSKLMGDVEGEDTPLSICEQLYQFVLEPEALYFGKKSFLKGVGISYKRSNCCENRECKLVDHWKSICE